MDFALTNHRRIFCSPFVPDFETLLEFFWVRQQFPQSAKKKWTFLQRDWNGTQGLGHM
jgi:hypothetical protein